MVDENRESFLKYISSKTVVFLKNDELFSSAIDMLFKKATEAYNAIDSEIKRAKPSELFCSSELLKKQLSDFTSVYLNQKGDRNLKAVSPEISGAIDMTNTSLD